MEENNNIELSIIMPCLNEESTIGDCIGQAIAWLKKYNIKGEIIIGDNGSSDGSVEIANKLGARVVHVATRGYGAACFDAAKHSAGKYILMGDSDGSYDFYNLMPFLEKLREGYDLVVGNRFKGKIHAGAMPWKNRYIGNPALSFIGRKLFRLPVNDLHCGIRAFSYKAFIKMDLQTTGMEFASEMIIKARLLNLRMCEIPTTLSKDGRGRASHLEPFSDGWRHLRFMLLYSPRWLFWYPGWAAIFSGLVLLGLIYPGPLKIGQYFLDIHTMLYASLLVIAGFQSLTFAMIIRELGFKLGLFPPNFYVRTLNRYFKLELILILGAVLIFLGILGFVWSIHIWQLTNFGKLDPSTVMRIIIPTSLLFITGIQLILFALAISFIDLGVRTRSV